MASVLYDPIMVALLQRLADQCGTTFVSYSRRMIPWQDLVQSQQSIDPVKQPALILYEGPALGGGVTEYVQQGRTPVQRTITRTVVIYARREGGGMAEGPDDSPGSEPFYPLIEAVEAALTPSPSDSRQTITLGGLVTHCWIEGEGILIPGDIDPNGQGMATLPVSILIP